MLRQISAIALSEVLHVVLIHSSGKKTVELLGTQRSVLDIIEGMEEDDALFCQTPGHKENTFPPKN